MDESLSRDFNILARPIPGYPRFRFRVKSAAKTAAEALQPPDTRCRDVDTMSVAMLCRRQGHQQRSYVEHLHQGSGADRPTLDTSGQGNVPSTNLPESEQ